MLTWHSWKCLGSELLGRQKRLISYMLIDVVSWRN
jgi:hypothetical protein